MKNYKVLYEKQKELITKLQSMVDSGQDYDRDYHEIWVELQSLEVEESKDTLITDEQKHIRDIVLEESKKGNVVYASFEGLITIPLDDIIKQPIEGLLYDLNRDVATVLTFINDPKWVNDYAVCSVITRLHKIAFDDKSTLK
jgi:hypothetical protein